VLRYTRRYKAKKAGPVADFWAIIYNHSRSPSITAHVTLTFASCSPTEARSPSLRSHSSIKQVAVLEVALLRLAVQQRPMESQTYHQTMLSTSSRQLHAASHKQPARATHTPNRARQVVYITTHARSDLGKKIQILATATSRNCSCNCEPEDVVQDLVLKNRDGERLGTIVDQPWACNCLQNWIHISHSRYL
jgi:hypothetical protein